MKSYDDLYCKVFVDTDKEISFLVSFISDIEDIEVDGNTLHGKNLILYTQRNDDFNETKRKEFPDGFLHYRYYLDIEPKEGTDQKEYIESISSLLTRLWDKGYKGVASCDFEIELPKAGGYKSQG